MKDRTARWIWQRTALLLAAGLFLQQSGLLILTVDAKEAAEHAATVHIKNAGEFQMMADQCREESFSKGKTFYLEADLDLSECRNLFIPVMSGLFEGNGHTITGVVLEEEMSDYGLFRYVGEGGSVRNLTVEAEINGGEEQENIGILAGSNAGEIVDCVSRGRLDGQFQIGGIAGFNEETGRISRSRNEAQIDGKNNTGGIAGRNEGEISDCTNIGSINTSQRMKKPLDGDGSVTISVPNAVAGLTKDERANQTGGIAGFSSGSISYCTNEGTVGYEHLGSSTGGIAGWQSGSISFCRNEGTIYGRKDVGGIAGYFDPYEAEAYDRDFRQELDDDLDSLSSALDDLQGAADQMGDHLSDNIDDLSDRMKAFRDSLRGHLDSYEDMADDDKDEIRDQANEIKDTIEGMEYDFHLEKVLEHAGQIQDDMQEMQEILDVLENAAKQEGGSLKEELAPIIAQYQQQLQKLKEALDRILQQLPADGESSGGDPASGQSDADADAEETNDSGGKEEDKEDNSKEDDKEDDSKEDDEEEDSSTGNAKRSGGGDEEAGSARKGPDGISAGSGRMVLTAFSMATAKGEESQNRLERIQAELAPYIQRLGELNDDIQVQLEGIMEIMERLPVEMDSVHNDIRTLTGNLDDLDHIIRENLDDWGDELSAMKDDLRDKGNGISDSLETAGDTLDADWDAVFDSFDRLRDRFTSIRATVSDTFDELKERIEDRNVYVDVSELMTDEKGEGKVFSCENAGEVYCDSQGGGIVGSITKESSENTPDWPFDIGMEDDEDDEEDSKDRIARHVQAAILRCVNLGQVTVTDEYAGGIVGKASYGIVRGSESYADVVTDSGKYVGGIAGKSSYQIVDCYMLGGVDGDAYVGGVAGEGEDISGNYVCSYLDLEEGSVKASGAVAGKAKGTVEGNYFVDNGYGAVDGITRSEEAEATDYHSMLERKEMPENFRKFTVRFRDGEETVWEDSFSYGDSLTAEDYPKLEDPEAGYAYWEEKNLDSINRNVTVHAVYRAYLPSLASSLKDPDRGKPEFLLGGEFYPDTVLGVREATDEEREKLQSGLKGKRRFGRYVVTQAYHYEIAQREELHPQVSLRVLDRFHGDRLMALSDRMESLSGIQEAQLEGSYMAVSAAIESSGYVVVIHTVDTWMVAAGVAGAAALLGAVFWLVYRRRKKKALQAGQEEENSQERTKEEEPPKGQGKE